MLSNIFLASMANRISQRPYEYMLHQLKQSNIIKGFQWGPGVRYIDCLWRSYFLSGLTIYNEEENFFLKKKFSSKVFACCKNQLPSCCQWNPELLIVFRILLFIARKVAVDITTFRIGEWRVNCITPVREALILRVAAFRVLY